MIVMGSAAAQENLTNAQREAEAVKRAQIAAERAHQRSEEAVRRAENHERHGQREMEARRRGDFHGQMKFVTDSTGTFRVVLYGDSTDIIKFRIPEMPDIPDFSEMEFNYDVPGAYHQYFRQGSFSNSKPGSSWNYSKRIAEASFVSDYSIGADAEVSEVNLSISGDCAEGSIIISAAAPDGSKLTEVVIDENGSMNWRKSFTLDDTKWNKGNWVFKVNAKNATGHFNISLRSF